MKKVFLIVGLFIAMPAMPHPMYSEGLIGEVIRLSLADTLEQKGRPRMPARPILIGLDGHTLYFHNTIDAIVNLYAEDEDGEHELAYSESLLNTAESIQLPSNLCGRFIIEIVRGGLHYVGELYLN